MLVGAGMTHRQRDQGQELWPGGREAHADGRRDGGQGPGHGGQRHEGGEKPGDHRAKIVPDEVKLLDAERGEDVEHVAGKQRKLVVDFLGGLAGATKATQVWRDDPIAGLGENRDLFPPEVGQSRGSRAAAARPARLAGPPRSRGTSDHSR